MQEIGRSQRIRTLFFSMMKISAFTFGGGFVIVTFIRRRFVDELHWLDEEEMLDLIALAQSAPGAIAVNAANLVGWRAAGFPGMLAAVLGSATPPVAVLTAVSLCYEAFAANPYVALTLRGMQAGVAAVVLDAALSLGRKIAQERSLFHWLVLALAFAASFLWKLNAACIVLGAFAAGACAAAYRRGKGEKP